MKMKMHDRQVSEEIAATLFSPKKNNKKKLNQLYDYLKVEAKYFLFHA